ncbi:MAG: nitroreductase family protein [Anaerolineae bacterium]|nr:nitroreductase family protein [Anaerolineae bacterium]
MNVFDCIRQRRSIRAYQDRPVPEAALQRILEAVNAAPSAGNLQAYEIFLVRDAGRRRALSEASFGQEYVAQAPVVLVFCTNAARSAVKYGQRGERLYCLQDATIACAYAQLAAVALGLGTVWVGAFDDDAVIRALDLPGSLHPVAILPIGYPAESPEPRPRRALEDLAHELA